MESLTKEAEKFSDGNSKIPVLYGFIYYDQARNLKREKKYEDALTLFGKALEFGDHWSFYNERAKIYHNKDMASAVRDLKKACELGNKKACKRYGMVKAE